MRSARVRSLAKINLDLRVLDKRPDGFHNLRTVFQTISLADTIRIEFARARRTAISVEGTPDIPDNLVARAARLILDEAAITATIRFVLSKRIPMGAGLGGGSSNAASVLLALPALAGVRIAAARLQELAAQLGSDVPFFLFGGAAVGLDRGTELYPLPDLPRANGLLVASGIHSPTADAYRDLRRGLTTSGYETDTKGFQAFIWGMGDGRPGVLAEARPVNDFEPVVFSRYPQLASIRDMLRRTGACPAMMTGSGSAIFGLFGSGEQAARAAAKFERTKDSGSPLLFRFVNRSRYRAMWLRQLKDHVRQSLWPPQSRYSKK